MKGDMSDKVSWNRSEDKRSVEDTRKLFQQMNQLPDLRLISAVRINEHTEESARI